jgi:adenylylsulfate kinase
MSAPKSQNIVWHHATINQEDRERLGNHKGAILWFTGLSGSGKSTIATEVEARLFERNVRTYALDGDNIPHGLNNDLGFSPEDREENIRRIGEVAKLFQDAAVVTLTAFISPYRSDRDKVRQLLDDGRFIEVYVKCSLDVCEERDPKGLYKKARAGQIPEFTGISAPYEEPHAPEILIETDKQSVQESAAQVIEYLETAGYLRADT